MIETVLFENVLPAIVYFRNKNQEFEIVDGQQRLVSIIKYISNEYPLNFDETDEAFVLKGFYFRDLQQGLKNTIFNYSLTLIKLTTDDPKRVTDVFLDLNYQPVPVTRNEIAISIHYGSIAKEAKRLSKSGAGKFVDFPVIWKLFGNQKAYKKDGSFTIHSKDKGGSLSFEVFKNMASFVEKRISVNKNRNWIKKQIIESGEKDISQFNLDNYLEVSNKIATVFKDELESKEKEKSVFFAKKGEKNTVSFIPTLADFLYLSLFEVNRIDNEKIKDLYPTFKIKVLNNLENEDFLNKLKTEFVTELRG